MNIQPSVLFIRSKFLKDPNSLKGMAVYLFGDRKNKGTIVDIDNGNPDTCQNARFLIHTKANGVTRLRENEFSPQRLPRVPRREIFKMFDALLVENLSARETSLTIRIKDYEEGIRIRKRDIRASNKSIKGFKKNLKELGSSSKSMIPLVKQLRMIKKHDKVKKAYVSKSFSVIVITEKLKAINEETGKESENLGKYVIRLRLDREGLASQVNIRGLDYSFMDHDHPHLEEDGRLCFGSNEEEARGMLGSGNLYGLVELIILLLSIFPQATGSPYVSYSDWLEGREKIGKKNDSYLEEVL